MRRSDVFILRRHTASHLLASWNVEELRCYRCGQLLQVGDLVHRRCQSGRLRIYHEEHWVEMFLDVSSGPIVTEKASVFSQSSQRS